MNVVAISGRLTRDVMLSYTSGDKSMAIAKFTVAVDRTSKDRGADFIPVTVFGRQAENCDRYLAKGRMVEVEGRIQTGSYEKRDGTRVYTTDVIASRVGFIGGVGSQSEIRTPAKEEPVADFEAIDENVPF